ncbi:MAG: response regulator transcription factor [Bdellovibrionales bacterium]|nr:response regulator transcription factor [Bdellovibrionales bacterium]
MKRILLIEDDESLASLLAHQCTERGYDVDIVHDGLQGLHKAQTQSYDLIILDLYLPSLDGIELLRRFRRENPDTPVLILSRRDSELDRVLGLEIGADDYVTKPFSSRELFARVSAIFRRTSSHEKEGGEQYQILSFGDYRLSRAERTFSHKGRSIELTAKEFDLLTFLVERKGRVFSKSELLQYVWGYTSSAYEHTVSSHMNRLRAKLGQDGKELLQTVWGVGYRFLLTPSSVQATQEIEQEAA